MKKYLVTTAIVGCLATSSALADPTYMLGVGVTFGGSKGSQVGVTAQALSTNQKNSWTGAAGVTYFPGFNGWGLNIGGGYNFNSETVTLTYDFLNQGAQLSAGWASLADPAGSI